MEQPINSCLDENDASVTALIVVLALVFGLYFFHMHHALADLSLESGQAASALSMLR
jgi:hypothetical protein